MTKESKVIDGQLWSEFCDSLKSAGQLILDNSEADELERAEGFRYLGRLTSNMLASSLDPAPLIPPKIEYRVTRIGANNPDFLYGSCRIRGSLSYRIVGQINDAYAFNIGAFHGRLGTAQGLQGSGFLNASDLEIDEHGMFEIRASRKREAGNWLELAEESNQLIIRQTILNPGNDKPAELTAYVTSSDVPAVPNVLNADKLDRQLGMAALMVHGTVEQFIGWTKDFQRRPNEIHPIKPELLGMANGDPNSQYNYGYFQLEEDEALLVHLEPPECDYWNIQLANHWMESLDKAAQPISINFSNAIADAAGNVTVAISRRKPQVENWLDTQGHERGVIALRWVGASAQKNPKTEVIRI